MYGLKKVFIFLNFGKKGQVPHLIYWKTHCVRCPMYSLDFSVLWLYLISEMKYQNRFLLQISIKILRKIQK